MIFGNGNYGKLLCNYFDKSTSDEVVAILDNNADEFFNGGGVAVVKPEHYKRYSFDKLIISNAKNNEIEEIYQQCLDIGIPYEKIIILKNECDLRIDILAAHNCYDEDTDPRVRWMRDFSMYVEKEVIIGNVAECGVYHGDFAYFINKYFPDRCLYLFDTFEGFNQEDLIIENKLNNEKFTNSVFNSSDRFANNDVEIVRRKMKYPAKIKIYKGRFPETARGINDTFCFVNLDMDLYQPMLEALYLFYPMMAQGGIILLHDYFFDPLPGVKQAVDDFEKSLNHRLAKTVIGDFSSIAIIKTHVD